MSQRALSREDQAKLDDIDAGLDKILAAVDQDAANELAAELGNTSRGSVVGTVFAALAANVATLVDAMPEPTRNQFAVMFMRAVQRLMD